MRQSMTERCNALPSMNGATVPQTEKPQLFPLLSRLRLWQEFDAADEAAILALPHTVQPLRANDFIVRQDDRPLNTCLLLTGFAVRHKLVRSGGRQIFSFHMSGDLVDLHNSFLGTADHNVQTLTAV